MKFNLKIALQIVAILGSLLELAIAVLALGAAYVLNDTVIFLEDIAIVKMEMVLIPIGIFCAMCSASYWLANSSFARTRLHVQIFIMCVLWTALVAIGEYLEFDFPYHEEFMFSQFEPSIYGDENLAKVYACKTVVLVIMKLICATNFLLTVWCVAQYVDMQMYNSKHL